MQISLRNNITLRLIQFTQQEASGSWVLVEQFEKLIPFRKILPPKGHIGILSITDKQFGKMEIYREKKEIDKPGTFQQLELF